MTQTLHERARHEAPAHRPQPIAFLDGTLWLGCWDDPKLFAIDPTTWSVRDEVAVPGIPYGLTAFDGALRVVVSIGDKDDRYIYRFVPGQPFGEAGRIACPDFHGSHLTTDGDHLMLVQQTNRRMLQLTADGAIDREIPFTTRCAGVGFAGKDCYMIAADADFDVLELATLDLTVAHPEPVSVAGMDVEARGLAFDGTAWWTSRREQHQILSFDL